MDNINAKYKIYNGTQWVEYLFNASNGIFYIEGSTSDTAGKWTGTSGYITELKAGIVIAYKTGAAGASGTTLNINNWGEVPVIRNATTAVSTQYPKDSVLILTYTIDNGVARWKAADYDSTESYVIRYNQSLQIQAPASSYPLLAQAISDGKYYAFYKTNTVNDVNNVEFNIHSPLLYDSSSGAITANTARTTSIYAGVAMTLTNIFKGATNLAANLREPVFLVGTKGINGGFIPYHNANRLSYQIGVPNNNTNNRDKLYWYLGYISAASTSSTTVRLEISHPVYYMDLDGNWKSHKPTYTYADIFGAMPKATASSLGAIQLGYTTANKKYKVEVDARGNAFVDVPWTDTNTNTWVANSFANDGYVTKGSGQANKVWKTDASGNPAWRDDANTDADTKNTAGTTNNENTKLFLAGATSQGANPQTYSNSKVYVGTDNELYSNSKKVLTEHQSLSGVVPNTRKINTKQLNADITLSASDVGAVNNSTAETIDAVKTWRNSAWSSGSETLALKTMVRTGASQYGSISVVKEGPNSGIGLRFDQVDGTTRLMFRGSSTAGAMVWNQPETNSTLYLDVDTVHLIKQRNILIQSGVIRPSTNNAGTIGNASYKWSNIYTTKINNGGDITIPSTSGTMALTSNIPTIPSFAGTGVATTMSRSDHNHDTAYAPKKKTLVVDSFINAVLTLDWEE